MLQCNPAQVARLDKPLPFELEYCGQLTAYKTREKSGIGYLYQLYGKTLSEISQKWLLLMAWGGKNKPNSQVGPARVANCLVHFCAYNFGQLRGHLNRYLKAKLRHASIAIDNFFNIDQIRLTLLTVNRSGRLFFDVYGKQVDLVEHRMAKCRRNRSAARLSLWSAIRCRIELVMSISENYILTMDGDRLADLLGHIGLELKYGEAMSTISSVVYMTLKLVHPLNRDLNNPVIQTTPVELIDQLLDTRKQLINAEKGLIDLDWMTLGGNVYFIATLARIMILQENSRILAFNHPQSISQTCDTFSRWQQVPVDAYLVGRPSSHDYLNVCGLLVPMSDTLGHGVRLLHVIGTLGRRSSFIVSIDRRDAGEYMDVIEIMVPRGSDVTIGSKVICAGICKSFYGKMRGDTLVLISLQMNMMKIVQLDKDNSVIVEKQIYDEADHSTVELRCFYQNMEQKKSRLYPKFDLNESHIACFLRDFELPGAQRQHCFFAVRLTSVGRPALYFEKITESDDYGSTRIISKLDSGHIANLLIGHKCFTVNMVVFRRGDFHRILRFKKLASIQELYQNQRKLGTVIGCPLLTYDSRSQSVKAWYSKQDTSGLTSIYMISYKVSV